MKLAKKTLTVILGGLFLLTNTLGLAQEEKLSSSAVENRSFPPGATGNSKLSPPTRLNSEEFKHSFTVAAICKHIEYDGDLNDTSYLNDVLARVDAGEDPNISVLTHEIIIEVPNEGLAVRYFDPSKANVITPYSDISQLETKIIGPRLNRQVIHRVNVLSQDVSARDKKYMWWILQIAERIAKISSPDRVPVAAMVVNDATGEEITRTSYAHPVVKKNCGMIDHSEMIALREAAENGWDLSKCTLYVTEENCYYCAKAVISAFGVGRIVTGCLDPNIAAMGEAVLETAKVPHEVIRDEGLKRRAENMLKLWNKDHWPEENRVSADNRRDVQIMKTAEDPKEQLKRLLEKESFSPGDIELFDWAGYLFLRDDPLMSKGKGAAQVYAINANVATCRSALKHIWRGKYRIDPENGNFKVVLIGTKENCEKLAAEILEDPVMIKYDVLPYGTMYFLTDLDASPELVPVGSSDDRSHVASIPTAIKKNERQIRAAYQNIFKEDIQVFGFDADLWKKGYRELEEFLDGINPKIEHVILLTGTEANCREVREAIAKIDVDRNAGGDLASTEMLAKLTDAGIISKTSLDDISTAPVPLDHVFGKLNVTPSFKVRPLEKAPAGGFPQLNQFEIQHVYPGLADDLSGLGLMPLDKTVHMMSVYYDSETPNLTLNLSDERTQKVIEGPFIYDMLRKLGRTGPLSLHLGFPVKRFRETKDGFECTGALSEEEVFDNIVRNIRFLKERLKQNGFGDKQVLLENTSYFPGNKYVCRPDFMRKVLRETGCGLLLDLGHVVVSATADKPDISDGEKEEPIGYLKKLVDEETVKLLGEIHISIPSYIESEGVWVHGGTHGTPYGSFYQDTKGVRAVKELLFYILDLRKRTGTDSELIINLETDDDFAKQDAAKLTEVLKEWEKTAPYRDYTAQNKVIFSDMAGTAKTPTLLRVPVEAIESVGVDNIREFLATFQGATNAYVELYYMSGIGEVSGSVYQKFGLQRRPLPKDFKRTRENTVTLFSALRGEKIDRSLVVSRLGALDVTPENTILSPVGIQHDPAGLIRATILGLKTMDVARQIKEKGIDITKDQFFRDKIQLEILEQLKNVCNADDLKNFDLTPDDVIALAAGTINNVLTSLKKLIKLLPITPINEEELRQIYEHAKAVMMAA